MTLLETLRGPRIGVFSAFDTLGTIIPAYLAARFWFNLNVVQSIAFVVGTLAIGELTHLIFGISTPFTQQIVNDKTL